MAAACGTPQMQLDALASGTISALPAAKQVSHATWLNISLARFAARLIQLPANKFTCATACVNCFASSAAGGIVVGAAGRE